MMIEARFLCALLITFLSPSGHGNQDGMRTFLRANALCHFITIKTRHADIENRKLRLKVFPRVVGSEAVVHRSHLMTIRTKESGKGFSGIHVIVCDKNTTLYQTRPNV